jgi:excisionase family DNA binding protein
MFEETEPGDLLDFTQALEVLGVSRPTLYRWIHQRKIKAFKAGKQWRFQREDLEAVLEEASPASDRARGDLAAMAEALGMAPVDGAQEAALELIAAAARRKATDVHLNPTEDGGCKVLLREGGALKPAAALGAGAAEALREALREQAGAAGVAESGQGRMMLELGGDRLEVRLTQINAVVGPQLVLRLINRSQVVQDLDRILPSPVDRAAADRILGLAYGLVLVSGPTGSGKTSTAYGLLHALTRRRLAVYSLEDPVDMLVGGSGEGVIQVPAAGGSRSYAQALRLVMQGDPDVIFLAEVPDQETARLACKVANAGHLVLVQVHANSASQAVSDFVQLAGDPRLVASSLAAASNQRLLRKVCPECRAEEPVGRELLAGLGLPAKADVAAPRAVGCERCVLGYRGRAAIYEFLFSSEALLDAVARGGGEAEVRSAALEGGMRSLQRAALDLLAEGRTTMEEIRRVLTVR